MMATLKGVSWGLSSLHRKLDSEKFLGIVWPSLLLRTKPVVAANFPVISAVNRFKTLDRTRIDGQNRHSLLSSPTSTTCAEKIYAIAESKFRIDWLAPWQRTSGPTTDIHKEHQQVKGIVGLNLSWCFSLKSRRKSNACIINLWSESIFPIEGFNRLTFCIPRSEYIWTI